MPVVPCPTLLPTTGRRTHVQRKHAASAEVHVPGFAHQPEQSSDGLHGLFGTASGCIACCSVTGMTSGIYAILNLVNGKVYIGSSINVNGRLAVHRIALARGKHGNSHLQGAWNKHGPGAFSFEVLKECPEDELLEQEQFHMDILDSMNPRMGYNSRGAERWGELSDESRAKMSAAHKGNHNALGYKHMLETRTRISNALKAHPSLLGRTVSAESKAKMSAAHTGKKFSPEARANMSAAHKGNQNVLGHRWKVKNRVGNRNSLGYKHTAETRAKMSAAQKRRRNNAY